VPGTRRMPPLSCRVNPQPISTASSASPVSRSSFPRRTFSASGSTKGGYALVGRETVDGRELLRIEYYPENSSATRRGGSGAGDAAVMRTSKTRTTRCSRS